MVRRIHKRKPVEEDSTDETSRARSDKAPRKSTKAVRYADTTESVSFSKSQKTKSILKTSSSPFPPAPEAADTKASPPPDPPTQPEDSEYDKEEVERMRMLAAASLKMAKDAQKEQQRQELKALQKELTSTKGALELFPLFERDYRQSQDKQARALADPNKRLEPAHAEVEEALFAKDRAEGLRKKSDEQVEILQQELTVLRRENEEMRTSLKNLAHIMEEAANGAAN